MDSSYLLVIDNSPDHAQVINSFLRNAGMAVRVANASNLSEFEQVLTEHAPFLILVGTQLPESLKIGQVLQAADKHSTPIILQATAGNSELTDAALATHSVQLVNGEENDQLMRVVQQHISGGKSVRTHDDLR